MKFVFDPRLILFWTFFHMHICLHNCMYSKFWTSLDFTVLPEGHWIVFDNLISIRRHLFSFLRVYLTTTVNTIDDGCISGIRLCAPEWEMFSSTIQTIPDRHFVTYYNCILNFSVSIFPPEHSYISSLCSWRPLDKLA